MKVYKNETALVNDLIATIQKKYGGFVLKVHGGRYQRTGIPDILYWLNGHAFAFEVKTGNNGYGVTALQQLKLDKLRAEGVQAHVVTQVQEVLKIIEEVITSEKSNVVTTDGR